MGVIWPQREPTVLSERKTYNSTVVFMSPRQGLSTAGMLLLHISLLLCFKLAPLNLRLRVLILLRMGETVQQSVEN